MKKCRPKEETNFAIVAKLENSVLWEYELITLEYYLMRKRWVSWTKACARS